jgi:adenosylhomocysteinase
MPEDVTPTDVLLQDLSWLERFIPATRAAARGLPSLAGERLLVVSHLDVKMVPMFAGLLGTGAEVWACAANPATTRDEVAEHLAALGVRIGARNGDPPERHAELLRSAIGAGPTLLSEMGADATVATGGRLPGVAGGLEATGTGIARLRDLDLAWPVFNWDEVPIKQGLHNRHLVGLMGLTTFLDVTGVSVYGRRLLVVGYGPVGRGIADAARSFGALVEVCDLDPAARLAAGHLGFPATAQLADALTRAEVVITATGRDGVVTAEALAGCPDGVFLANLGHGNTELPVAQLRSHVVDRPRPHVEVCEVAGRTRYLLAGGAMLNLAAGPGDPYDTFDLVTALMLEATGWLAREGRNWPPGVHLLPEDVTAKVASLVVDSHHQ